jgi:broad specificity phosphatase PhoE
MKLYLVRHGETDVNRMLNHGVTGPMHNEPVDFKEGDDTNIHLNILGRAQAQEAAMNLPDKFNGVYSSPLLRVKDTAEIILNIKKVSASEIIVRDELIEYYQGSLEGLSTEQKIKIAGGKVWGSNLLCTYDYTKWGGDSWESMYSRVNSFFDELRKKHGENDVILCVTSAGLIRMVYKILLSHIAPEISKHITINNGSVHEFVI